MRQEWVTDIGLIGGVRTAFSLETTEVVQRAQSTDQIIKGKAKFEQNPAATLDLEASDITKTNDI